MDIKMSISVLNPVKINNVSHKNSRLFLHALIIVVWFTKAVPKDFLCSHGNQNTNMLYAPMCSRFLLIYASVEWPRPSNNVV